MATPHARYSDETSETSDHNTIKPVPAEHQADGLDWRRSSYSNGSGGMCVEVALITDGPRAGGALVRDSADPTGPVLSFSQAEWRAFNDGVENGEFRF